MACAQAKIDIVEILRQSIEAEMVTKLCGVERLLESSFANNCEIVNVRATETLVQRNPALTVMDVKPHEINTIRKTVEGTSLLIRRMGCSNF